MTNGTFPQILCFVDPWCILVGDCDNSSGRRVCGECWEDISCKFASVHRAGWFGSVRLVFDGILIAVNFEVSTLDWELWNVALRLGTFLSKRIVKCKPWIVVGKSATAVECLRRSMKYLLATGMSFFSFCLFQHRMRGVWTANWQLEACCNLEDFWRANAALVGIWAMAKVASDVFNFCWSERVRSTELHWMTSITLRASYMCISLHKIVFVKTYWWCWCDQGCTACSVKSAMIVT